MGECIIARRGGGLSKKEIPAYLSRNANDINVSSTTIYAFTSTNGEVKIGDLTLDSETVLTIVPESGYIMDKSGQYALKDGVPLVVNSYVQGGDGAGNTCAGTLTIIRRGAIVYGISNKTAYFPSSPSSRYLACSYTLKQEYCSC